MRKYIFLFVLVLSVSLIAQTSGYEVGGRLYGKAGTVATNADTLSRELSFGSSMTNVFKNWFNFCIITDDTLQVSNTVSFGSYIVILPDIPYTSTKLSVKLSSNIYIKRYGYNGTPNYFISVEGN